MVKENFIYVGIDLHKETHTAVMIDCYNQKLGGGGHHGVMPYYKVSSGKNGTVRYYINGERAQ